jgi:hypothetical protein
MTKVGCLLVVSTRFTGRERKFFFVSKQNEMVTKEQSNAFECSETRAQQNRTAEEVSSDQRTRTLKRGGRRVLLPSIAGTVSTAERKGADDNIQENRIIKLRTAEEQPSNSRR